MRVIIPAAGRGTRLQPLTNFSPKCLVEINNKPLIFYLLTALKRLDVTEVIIVTGHLNNMIEDYVSGNSDFPIVKCIYNNQYDSTNSIVSISLTRDVWDDDFCIIDSDLLIKAELLQKLIASKDTCLIVDNSKPPEDIDMKVKVENGYLVHMDKSLLRKETYGEFFGLSRWTPASARLFLKSIDRLLSENNTNVWYEFAIRELAKKSNLPILTCSSDTWFEIDNMEDYNKASGFLDSDIRKNQ